MKLKTKTAFVIPAGTIVTEKMMKWIMINCTKTPKYDLPEGFETLFGNLKNK